MLSATAGDEELSAPQARMLLAVVLLVFVGCGLIVALGTPSWEANDEPDHLRNVESLVVGNMYRIGEAGGLESHQPPLYYLVLAGYQHALGVSEHGTRPAYISVGGPRLGLWDHSTPSDSGDQRFVTLMRLPGLLMGTGVIVLTYATTRLLARSRLTALAAAAIIATLPKFVFLSAVVNNDNLANLIGAAVVYLAIRAVTITEPTRRRAMRFSAALGAAVGLSLATKLTSVALILPAAFAAFTIARRSSTVRTVIPLFVSLTIAPSLPWAVFTAREYHDPFAGRVSGEYFDAVIPGLMRKHLNAQVFLSEMPKGFWKTFWYSSGWNQYFWDWLAYLPLWSVAIPALLWGLLQLSSKAKTRDVGVALALTLVAALAVFVYIGVITTGTQARVTFVGLAAFAVLVARGVDRLHPAARFALPVMSLIGTLVAIRTDVVHLFVNR